ncbi:MAG TPA: CcoQ/FixQ family Cbb3-type cytochrome c oxidase assembly chaperone [Chitinophagales bacterium]|nr:CcoQ/FixQ family Cbb3-type cytochrome c oxidase assembly chaperone [Chitinophagales bacterium]
MIRNYLSSIDGVAVFPLISFLIFFSAFCIVLLVTFFRGKAAYDDVAALPLASDDHSVDLKSSSRYEDQ